MDCVAAPAGEVGMKAGLFVAIWHWARPRRSRLTGQQTQCRIAHRTRRLRHAPTPRERHTWRQRVADRIRGPAAGPDKASRPALPPSRNPALPRFRNTPTNKPLSAPGTTLDELVTGQAYNVERVHDLGSVQNDLTSGGGIALEAIHADDFDLIAELLALIIQPCAQRVSASSWDNVKKPGRADDVSILVVVVGHINDDGDISVAPFASVVRPAMLINTDDLDPVEVVLVVIDQVANSGYWLAHPRPNDLAAAATLIRSRQSRCRIQRVTLSAVFELSGAQARPARKIFCKQRLLVHRSRGRRT